MEKQSAHWWKDKKVLRINIQGFVPDNLLAKEKNQRLPNLF